MVRGRDRVGLARAAGRVLAPARSRARRATHGSLCVIQCRTRSPSRAHDDFRVLGERLGGRARGPAALVLERLRRVPVEERRERLDAVARAARRRAGRRSRARPRSPGRGPRAGCAATRSRSGTRRARARASAATSSAIPVVEVARDVAACRRCAPCPASRRSGPRCSRRGRPRARRPRSGTTPWRRPRRSRVETSCSSVGMVVLSISVGAGAVT